jgi:hypothetical protein
VALGALTPAGLSLSVTSRQDAYQNDIAEQAQITQRYTTAINQLGSDTEDVRLGGIYALRRIMNSSPIDQPTIVSVLSAFVRNHPPGNPHAGRASTVLLLAGRSSDS